MVLKAIVEFESTLQGHEACDLTVSPYRVCYLGGDSWGFLPSFGAPYGTLAQPTKYF